MTQSTNDKLLLWSTLLVAFIITVALARAVSSDTDRAARRAEASTMSGHVYTGPSGHYAASPHTGALTYSMSDTER